MPHQKKSSQVYRRFPIVAAGQPVVHFGEMCSEAVAGLFDGQQQVFFESFESGQRRCIGRHGSGVRWAEFVEFFGDELVQLGESRGFGFVGKFAVGGQLLRVPPRFS